VTRNRDLYGDDTDYEKEYGTASATLCSALTLIKAIAASQPAKRGGGPAPHVQCEQWLDEHGYETEAKRKVREQGQRDHRAAELDREIERLRAERETL
jgi:hypothetical protein